MKESKTHGDPLPEDTVKYIIELTSGPRITAIANREPQRAKALVDLLTKAVNELWSSNPVAMEQNRDGLIRTILVECERLTDMFILNRVCTIVDQGIDRPSKIVRVN